MAQPSGNTKIDFNSPDWVLEDLSKRFDVKMKELNDRLAKALEDANMDPTNPIRLAALQAENATYITWKNLQAAIVKKFADLAQGFVAKM